MPKLPYTPTHLLCSPADQGPKIYIFQPPVDSNARSQMLFLNANETLDAEKLVYGNVVTNGVLPPFLAEEELDGETFTPAMDAGGNIMVYTGKCRDGAGGARVWNFTPGSGDIGRWVGLKREEEDGFRGGALQGANFLASGIAFSSTVNASSDMFVFGGMCPDVTPSAGEIWTHAANYSNAVLTIETTSTDTNTYRLHNSTGRGPPIPEAGFTITPLEPTFSQSPGGDQTQIRNQNFMLLGGHTQEAFINMSQVALFSLPEQTWSFLSVDSPPNTPKTDLTRDIPLVEPRSGHTAVLTPDGKQMIIFGGWVGDVQTLANPQLVILELGKGYGGNGDWQWTIPTQAGIGPEKGVGLFGHGAAMLPGGVMMIVGGYVIPGSSPAKMKRADLAPNTKNYFFNTTTSTWIRSFTPPKVVSAAQNPTESGSHSNAAAKKAGLQAGLSLGILALFALVLFYFWYMRHLKRRREAREKDLRNLAAGAHRTHLTDIPWGGQGAERISAEWMRDQSRPLADGYPWAPGPPGSVGERAGREGNSEAERTGLLFEVPSPTRGLRRSLHSRGTFQITPRYEDGRRGHGLGGIHPIDERDEYDEDGGERDDLDKPEMSQRRGINILQSAPILDPFSDPDDLSRSPSPGSSTHARELEVQNWVSDWTAADALMHQQAGRISPDKTDRTSSTLSEKSTRSTMSAHSYQHAGGSVSRSMSQRSVILSSAKPSSPSTNPNMNFPQSNSQQEQRLHPQSTSTQHHRRSRSLTLFSSTQPQNPSDTFNAAPPSFPQLQFESEALLGGSHAPSEQSPTRSKSRAREWMGSMRRAFTGTDRITTESAHHGDLSTSSSPTKYHHHDAESPRRAASTGAMLWKRKQGARDWDVEGAASSSGQATDATAPHHEADDEEWDIESAVERRVVQVMFTVPREKLRIVNGGPEGDGESFVSAEVKPDQDDAAGSGNGIAAGTGKGKGKEPDREEGQGG